jgi:hypothetical protein
MNKKLLLFGFLFLILLIPTFTSATTLTNDLSLYWNFDENTGTKAGDSLGVYNGTLVNGGLPVTPSQTWGSYINITSDTNAPSPWTWGAVQALDLYIEGPTKGPHTISIYEIRVTYTPYTDIGLRFRTGTATIKIGVQALDGHKLRIRKGATTYGIPLVATSDPNASKIRFRDGATTKALVIIT